MYSWWPEIKEQTLFYLLAGLAFVPFGVIYAILRVRHHQTWFVLFLPLLGGIVTASVIRAFVQRRQSSSTEKLANARPESQLTFKVHRGGS